MWSFGTRFSPNSGRTRVEIVEKNPQLASQGPERTQRPSGVETRWNSFVKCMLRILEIPTQLNMAMSFKLKDTDLYTLRIAVLVLSPICWATDVSQSDTASLATVRQTVSQIEKDMEFLMTVNYRQTDLRNDILIAVKDMLKCLASRVEKNLMNGLVRLWDFFDPTTPDAETDAFVLNNVSKYFADCGIEVESDTLRRSDCATSCERSSYEP